MSYDVSVVARLEPLIVKRSEGRQVTGTLHCSRTLLKISMNRLFQKFTSQMLWPLARMNYNCITKSWFMALDRHNMLWSQHFKTHITGRIWLPYYSNNQSFVHNKLAAHTFFDTSPPDNQSSVTSW